MNAVDFLVIGAGMAGTSVAAELTAHGSVMLVETEERPAMHATGRSAAIYVPSYGSGPILTLTLAAKPVFEAPPERPDDPALLNPRWALRSVTEDQLALLDAAIAAAPGLFERIDGAEAERLVPWLRPGALAAALLDRTSADIDVDALMQRYLRRFRAAGGTLKCGAPVTAIAAQGGGWSVTLGSETVAAGTIVNAAGAWVDPVAQLAGLAPIGLTPMRRTAALVDAPEDPGFAGRPAVIDIAENFYFKPDAGKLLVSPAEETPVEPHDAYADDEALVEGIDRIMQITTIEVTRMPTSWAGLRTFAPDRVPVIGRDPTAPAPFVWLAGQGGYGIQTAPSNAQLAAALAASAPLPAFADATLVERLSPARFRG